MKNEILSPENAASMFGGSGSVADMFSAILNDDMNKEEESKSDSWKSKPGNNASSNSSDGGIPPASQQTRSFSKKPAISKEEADDMLSRLDNLTDEEVERVFAKMRQSIASAAKVRLAASIEERRSNITPPARAAPQDKEVRKKYDKELSAIENELESMYKDPLKVWEEIMMNPEKYLGSENTEGIEDEELQ